MSLSSAVVSFDGCKATHGGALYISVIAEASEAVDVTLTSLYMLNCSAGENAGGVYVSVGNTTKDVSISLTEVWITNATASKAGTSLYLSLQTQTSSLSLTYVNVSQSDSSSSDNESAVYVEARQNIVGKKTIWEGLLEMSPDSTAQSFLVASYDPETNSTKPPQRIENVLHPPKPASNGWIAGVVIAVVVVLVVVALVIFLHRKKRTQESSVSVDNADSEKTKDAELDTTPEDATLSDSPSEDKSESGKQSESEKQSESDEQSVVPTTLPTGNEIISPALTKEDL